VDTLIALGNISHTHHNVTSVYLYDADYRLPEHGA